jgi:hypothetical protein
LLIGVLIFPIAEVWDEVLANFDGRVVSDIVVKELPRAYGLIFNQTDRKKDFPALGRSSQSAFGKLNFC